MRLPTSNFLHRLTCGAIICELLMIASIPKENNPNTPSIVLPSGDRLTPLVAPGARLEYLNPELRKFPHFIAGGAMSMLLSPDQKTLLVLTSGYNLLYNWLGKKIAADSTEYIFVYGVSASRPAKKQVIKIPDSFAGIAFSPDGQKFYVGGGRDDDIHTYGVQGNGSWAEDAPRIQLRHSGGNGLDPGQTPPVTGGLAATSNGSKLVIANVYNDSISIVDLSSFSLLKDIDLRPGKRDPDKSGVPGGEYPFWVVVKGNDVAYISSLRDREIVVVNIGSQPGISRRIKIKGNPNKMILDRRQIFLYVAEDNSDRVTVIDTRSNDVVGTVSTVGPARDIPEALLHYHGSAPNGLALSPDGTTLYVTNGGTNSVAVIKGLPDGARTIGLIPTGYYPYAISVSADGRMLYVVNGKSPSGPNPGYLPVPNRCYFKSRNTNQFVEALQQSSLLSFSVPDEETLAQLSRVVAENNSFGSTPSRRDQHVMAALRQRIKHVIYVVKRKSDL
jgi:DNA-binding beta-propeller fold protein YncE